MALNKRQQRITLNLSVTSSCFIVFLFTSGGKSKRGYFDYIAKLYQRGIKVTAKNIKSPLEDCQQFAHNGKQLKPNQEFVVHIVRRKHKVHYILHTISKKSENTQQITRCVVQPYFFLCLGDISTAVKFVRYLNIASVHMFVLKQGGSGPSHAAGTASRPFGLVSPLAGPADSTARKISGSEVGEPVLF